MSSTMLAAEDLPRTLYSLRREHFHDAAVLFGTIALITTVFWLIGFNSHGEDPVTRNIVTLVLPALAVYELMRYWLKKKSLEYEP